MEVFPDAIKKYLEVVEKMTVRRCRTEIPDTENTSFTKRFMNIDISRTIENTKATMEAYRKFMTSMASEIQIQLERFYFPFIFHLILHPIIADNMIGVNEFIRSQSGLLTKTQFQLLKRLVEDPSFANESRERRFTVSANELVLNELFKFIEEFKYVQLLYIINTRIDIVNQPIYEGYDVSSGADIFERFCPQEKEPNSINPDIAHFTLYDHHDDITYASINRQLNLLCTTTGTSLRLHCLNNAREFPNHRNSTVITHHKTRIAKFQFGNNIILSGSIDGELRVSNLDLCMPMSYYNRNPHPITAISLGYNDKIFSASYTNRITALYAMNQPREVRLFISDALPALASVVTDGKLIEACADRKVRIFDIGTANIIETVHGLQSTPMSIAVRPQMDIIAVGTKNGSIMMYNTLEKEFKSLMAKEFITDLKFSNDGSCLYASSSDGTIRIWDMDDTENPKTIEIGYTSIVSLTVSEKNLLCSVGYSTK